LGWKADGGAGQKRFDIRSRTTSATLSNPSESVASSDRFSLRRERGRQTVPCNCSGEISRLARFRFHSHHRGRQLDRRLEKEIALEGVLYEQKRSTDTSPRFSETQCRRFFRTGCAGMGGASGEYQIGSSGFHRHAYALGAGVLCESSSRDGTA